MLGKTGCHNDNELLGDVFFGSALESVVVPSTLEVLEKHTFCKCRKLSSVVFAEGSRLREIGEDCFAITGLRMFKASPNLRKIGNGAFCFCKNLQRVVLNEGLETMGEDDE